MGRFLSCDWGVSSFRLRLVDARGFGIVAEEKNNQGIAAVFESWRRSGKPDTARPAFYLEIVRRYLRVIEKRIGDSLNQMPLIISGMASSSIGIIDLPYKELPFSADGSDLEVKLMDGDDVFSKVIIISGAKGDHEVMRGEETQLAGCSCDDTTAGTVFLFPGTHSKHVLVRNGKAVQIKTYMTGEFFALLTEKSILSTSIEKNGEFQLKNNSQSFQKGVTDSKNLNLLQSCFRVRTNDLLGKCTRQENYFYLSGLLIGAEMSSLSDISYSGITLVSDKKISPYYESAFKLLNENSSILEIRDADDAVVKGQYKIYERLLCGT